MLNIIELSKKISQGELKAVEVLKDYLRTIKTSQLNSFLTVSDQALAEAEAIDKRLAQGKAVGPLSGVPIAVKDVITTAGLRTTAASRILENYLPAFEATVVARIKQADAVVIGKTNCDEFAMGGSGENSAFGPSRNPWDTSRTPGGSSSGSAAAVANQECAAALGTDTGGSIRQPAAFCGLVGLKPTYGRVSRWGLLAMTSSFDQAGPLTRTVAEAAYLLKIIAGHDEHDATSAHEPVPDYTKELSGEIKGLRLGVPKEFFTPELTPAVRQVVETAIDTFKQLGVSVTEVSLPNMPYALAAYYVICPSEVSANLARYDGIRFGRRETADSLYQLYTRTRGQLLGAEVKRRIMLGTFVLSAGYYEAYYRQAQLARQFIKHDFATVFKNVDALITPATPSPAFTLGSKVADPLVMYLEDVYMVPVNIAGLPAVSVPGGFVDNLPVGLQLIGQAFDEATILRLAHHYEQATEWHKFEPPSS